MIATQNPIDHEGTFPLPEAQLDRFLMRFSLGYPTMDEELQMLEMLQHRHPVNDIEPVVSADELVACQQAVREIRVDEKVRQYLMQIVHDTREHEDLNLGGSPRASIALFRTSQALAALRGRTFVLPDDVKRVAGPVLTHRVILKPESRLRKVTARAGRRRGGGRNRGPDDVGLTQRADSGGSAHWCVAELASWSVDCTTRDDQTMRWLTAAILILILALLFRMGLLAYAMYVLLGVLITSRVLSQQWATNLSVQRECNRLTAEIGETVAVVVTITNQGVLPIAWVLAEDLLPRRAIMFRPPNLQVEGQRLKLQMLWSKQEKSMFYRLTCNRRGYYQLGPTVVETGDLFGLHRRFRVANEPHFLLVYPRVIPLEGYDIASRRPIGEVRMTYRLYEDPTRIAGVRAYLPGDPLTRVHWRATARTGELHSKVYEPSTIVGATLLLEFHSGSHRKNNEPFRSELAVTAAASVANAVYLMGQQIGLVTNGRDAVDRIRVEGWDFDPRSREQVRRSASMLEKSERLQPVVVETRRGVEQLRRILETLARVELTDGLRLPELIDETESRLPRDATVIAILPQVNDETVVTLQDLRRRGYAVAAILNMHDEYDFSGAAAALEAIGVDTHHLKDEASIPHVCRRILLR